MSGKVEIKPIGGYWQLDKEGYILNIASIDKVAEPWKTMVSEAVQIYKNIFRDKIHSIYLRGSIANGSAELNVADLDLFALIYTDVNNYVRWKSLELSTNSIQKLEKIAGYPIEADLAYSSYIENLSEINRRLAMVIKTQSICIYGEDISAGLAGFKPGKEMMLNISWLKEDLNDFLRNIEKTPNERTELVKQFSKVLIRSGFDLVMEREEKYTTSLYYCYTSFSNIYPSREAEMRQVLEIYLNPAEVNDDLIRKLSDLANWIMNEYKAVYS